MIKKEGLEEYKNVIGFNLYQLEKDYLQHLLLLILSRHTARDLVFKGGTALQKAYGLNRFSEDLDFTKISEINLDNLMKTIKAEFATLGIQCKFTKEENDISVSFRFRLSGPLYEGSDKTMASLHIDISKREATLSFPEAKEIVPLYKDIQPYITLVMPEEEIFAEKIRAIFSRNRARDIYDFWFLLKRGVKQNLGFVNKKLAYYEKEYSKQAFVEELDKSFSEWGKLQMYLTFKLPDKEKIKKEIMQLIKL